MPDQKRALRPEHARAVGLMRLLLAATILVPMALFAYAAWFNHAAALRNAEDRLGRAVEVLQEHALRVFETVERSLAETDEIVRGLSDEDIRRDEARIGARLRQISESLRQIQSVWIFDADGRALVTSVVSPVPRTDVTDRGYYTAHVERDIGTYIDQVLVSRVTGNLFFNVSRRRHSPDGRFTGVTAAAVYPSAIKEFYARLAGSIADQFALVRADGEFLARYPSPDDRPVRLDANSVFARSIRTQPEGGTFDATSQVDRIERRFVYRKLPGYPVYVQAGISTATIRAEWLSALASQLAFGLPATLVLIGISWLALRRTRTLYEEAARREAAEGALQQAQRLEAVGQMTGGIAHDFNNLLMVVSGGVDRLRRDLVDPRQRRTLDMIGAAAKRAEGLTRQLLVFSRRQALAPQVVSLPDALSGMSDMLRSSLRGDIELVVDAPEDLWRVRVDPGEFEIAVLNLAMNARDAMPRGGRIEISARNQPGGTGDRVALTVSDTGAGIPPEVLPRIFEPFFTTKDVGKGTGLGLSQVYGFAQQSAGEITVESRPGRTTFRLVLPRCLETTEHAPVSKPITPSVGRGRALLVEDNSDVAEVSAGHLRDLGFEIDVVPDAGRALERLGSGSYVVMVSDVVMPGGVTGLDLAREVRARHPGLPILLVTGYSAVADEAVAEGFTLLRKPYDLQELAGALDGVLASAAHNEDALTGSPSQRTGTKG
ncbi:hybrid sensor histidine kinase/response regulator [Salinarimonas soli]|nr:hybrid sensor histidine kinase/response regulator [Salinarimonas soli]